jgi:ribonuclease BN (tRNA processing enzyme)
MPPLEWLPLADEILLRDGARLSHFPLRHPGGSRGYRIDWPTRSLAYVTDTTARSNADYLRKIQGVDLLIHECYFPDHLADRAELTGHSCITPVAEVAKRAGVKRLVLVHVNPLTGDADPIGLETARAIFPKTDLGSDGQEIEF